MRNSWSTLYAYAHPRLQSVSSSWPNPFRSGFLSSGLASSPLYYTAVLTALFESIAVIIDQHQPVVEKYYGTGKMANVTLKLLEECDRITISLIDNWKEQRSIQRKV
jgi:hypothetical protein